MVVSWHLSGGALMKIDIYFQRVMAPELLVELDDPVELVADLARYAKAGHADGDTQRVRLGFRHGSGAHRDLGAAFNYAVLLRHEPCQRTVERKIQQIGAVASIDIKMFDQNDPSVHGPQSANQKNWVANSATKLCSLPGARNDSLFRQDLGAGNAPLPGHAFGKAGIGGRVIGDSRWRDKPAPSPLAVGAFLSSVSTHGATISPLNMQLNSEFAPKRLPPWY